MLLSHSKKFIFIHVPKTAGRSIEHILEPYHYCSSLKNRIKRKYQLFYPIAPAGKFDYHIKAVELQAQIPSATFEQYFKFTFVRNPWDWLVSLYFYTIQTPKHVSYRQFKKMGNFEACVEWMTTQGTFFQKDYICDQNDRLLVDFVGKFENLTADFQKIATTLNLPHTLADHFNASQRGRNYRDYYTTKMRQQVAKAYQADIELFEYQF